MKPKDSVWKHKNKSVKEIPEGMQGFIYQITHTETGKSYIGKKQFFNTLNMRVSKKRSDILYSGKGRKPTREKKINESNWKVYTSSSKELNDDIEKYGITAFKFIILEYAPSLSLLKYMEAKYQLIMDCIKSENWYNHWIQIKIHRKHLIIK